MHSISWFLINVIKYVVGVLGGAFIIRLGFANVPFLLLDFKPYAGIVTIIFCLAMPAALYGWFWLAHIGRRRFIIASLVLTYLTAAYIILSEADGLPKEFDHFLHPLGLAIFIYLVGFAIIFRKSFVSWFTRGKRNAKWRITRMLILCITSLLCLELAYRSSFMSIFLPDETSYYALRTTKRFDVNAAGFRGEDLSEANQQAIIFSIGDSSTFGDPYWFDNSFSYSHLLQQNLNKKNVTANLKVVNLGVPGFTLGQSVARAKYFIEKGIHPQLIVALSGQNDDRTIRNIPAGEALRYRAFDRFSRLATWLWFNRCADVMPGSGEENPTSLVYDRYNEHLIALEKLAEKAGARLLLCTYPNTPAAQKPEFSRLLRLFAAEHKVPLADLEKVFLVEGDRLSSDGVHPNRQGHQLIAELLADRIEVEGFLESVNP